MKIIVQDIEIFSSAKLRMKHETSPLLSNQKFMKMTCGMLFLGLISSIYVAAFISEIGLVIKLQNVRSQMNSFYFELLDHPFFHI
jgi:hypothetical protein